MRRIVDTDKIDTVTMSLTEKLNLIQETKKELLTNIQKISECYKGKDAELIKKKYTEELNKLDVFINTIDSYTKYFKWLTSNYGDNLNKTKNSFSMINNDFFVNKNDTENKIINKLNLENSNIGDD